MLAHTLARLALPGGPLLVTVDEMERATPDDVRLLTACWRAACQQGAPLDLALAGRDDAPDWLSSLKLTAALSPQASVTTYTLDLLDEPGMALLVRNRLGPTDERFPGWLQARTGGQPLWAAQLIAHLRAGGALRFESGAWHFIPPPLESLPDTLRGLLEQRWPVGLDQPGAADLLDALAVSRTPLPLSALAAVTGLPGDDVQSRSPACGARGSYSCPSPVGRSRSPWPIRPWRTWAVSSSRTPGISSGTRASSSRCRTCTHAPGTPGRPRTHTPARLPKRPCRPPGTPTSPP
ncbi:hypothetical protein GCM10010844_43750 [Deinococcus radiotolerans]|uniref:Uncharacterized protein n=1 Tax=Deinococcus radiotolerans TaxID=1309407 RepID=A0ABQ2FRN4_9DEIO|nr:hypothetical protein GCM10010844_43750 [Deinococcus radiotolerans]